MDIKIELTPSEARLAGVDERTFPFSGIPHLLLAISERRNRLHDRILALAGSVPRPTGILSRAQEDLFALDRLAGSLEALYDLNIPEQ